MATEKITIAELDIDTSKLVKTASDTTKAIQKLKEEQAILKLQGKQTTEGFVKNDVALKKLQKTYREQTKVIGELNLETEEQIDLTKEITTLTNKESKSIEGARKNNKDLLAIRNKLNLSTKEGRDQLTKINAKLDDNNAFIKENVSGYEQQKIGIGDYEGALRKVFPQMNGVLNTLKSTKTALTAQAAAQKSATTATSLSSKALRIFKIALISTGIGAIVVALGSLVLFLTKSQKGIDAVSRVFKAVGSVVDVLVDRFIKVGEVLSNIFSQSIFKTLAGVKDAFSGVGDEIQREIDLVIELERATQKLRDVEIDQIQLQATRRKLIEEARFLAKDELKDISERVGALDLATQLERANLEERLVNARERARISQAETDRAESTAEELKANQEIQAEVINLETQSLKLLRTLEAERQSLLKRGRAAELKIKQDRLKDEEDEAKAAEKKIEDEEKRQEAEIKRIQDFEDRKRDLENEFILLKEQDDTNRAILKAEQDLEDNLLEIERIELTKSEQFELEGLLLEAHEANLEKINDDARKKEEDKEDKFIKDKLKREEDLAKKQISIRNKSFETAVRLAGEETRLGRALLAAKELFALKETIIELKRVSFKTQAAIANSSTAIAEGTAQTAKIGFPQNIPLLLGFAAQVGGIISAIKQASSLGRSASFYNGGRVPYGSGGKISGQNIPTQRGGDNILATVKSGEVILNRDQQARAGGGAFFSSIGVPGFANGGVTTPPPTVSSGSANVVQNTEAMANIIAGKINDIQIVAIVDEIAEGLVNKTEIVDGANV